MCQRLALLCCLLFLFGCPPPAKDPKTPPTASGSCSDAQRCEEALVAAERDRIGTLLADYERHQPGNGWSDVFDAMLDGKGKALLIGTHGAVDSPPAGVITVRAPQEPKSVDPKRLILALGRAAGLRHVIWLDGTDAQQLFPIDPLAAFTAGAPPVLPADAAHLDRDVTLAFEVAALLERAGRFDYLGVTKEIDRVRELVRNDARRDGSLARAELALELLDTKGITLETIGADDDSAPSDTAAPTSQDWPELGTAYGELLAVRLSNEPAPLYLARRATIARGIDDERIALFDALYADDDSCPAPQVPPMDGIGDLYFANTLANALDLEHADPQHARPGSLVLSAWLPRYEAMLGLVESGHLGWAFVTPLLRQRGELNGLSALGTNTHRRVNELALEHFAALERVAQSEPARFRALVLASYAFLPGVLGDRQLRNTLGALVEKSAALKLEQANDVAAVAGAAVAAFMSGISYPPPLQAAQFSALDAGMGKKLAGAFAQDNPGWELAGLEAGHALLGLLLGRRDHLSTSAARIGDSLRRADDLPYPGLGKLAIAAVGYAGLIGTGALDATTANPKMFKPERIAVRDALQAALAELGDDGPNSGADRELLARTAALADGLVALMAAKARAEDSSGPSCGGDPSLAKGTALRDSYDRLLKKRREMTEATAFSRGDGRWLTRIRLVGLVLSDVTDMLHPAEGLKLTVPPPDAEKIIETALAPWAERELAEIVTGGYLLARTAADQQSGRVNLGRHTARVLAALAALFDDMAGQGGLFKALSRAGKGVVLAGDDEIGQVLVSYAHEAYRDDAVDQGDLFLFLAMGVSLWRDQQVPPEALSLAQKHDRPVRLPLLLYDPGDKEARDPTALADAMRSAAKKDCAAPSPEAVIRLRRATYDFEHGRRTQARQALDELLEGAVLAGLEVPRMTLAYHENSAEKVFKVEGSFSFGSGYLKNAASLQVGLGYQSRGTHGSKSTLSFNQNTGPKANEESVRLYAHAALLAALMHYAEDDNSKAARDARRAVTAYAHGVRLGKISMLPADKTGEWASDATGHLAIAAQIAAERGDVFMAGDLWTLAKAALGPEADDEQVDGVLEPLPTFIAKVPELAAAVPRAKASLRVLAGPLSCTKKAGDPKALERTSCARYPLALSLRVADGLATLPRLTHGAEAQADKCLGWRALDTFLGAANEGRYEPQRLIEAVDKLRRDGRAGDAGMLLTRQRNPRHCTPALLAHVRALARNQSLEIQLRSDLLSISANCSGGAADPHLTDDLVLLNELTAQHANPQRNLEVVLFATRVAHLANEWEPLARITVGSDFIKRWQKLSPDAGTSALLLHHAAQIATEGGLDPIPTLPYYRLLCTTYPPKQRAPMCNTVTLLRGNGTIDEKKRAAKVALESLLRQR